LQVYNGGWSDIKNPKHYGTDSSTTAMCLDHTKESPTGTQNYVRYSASSMYSTSTIKLMNKKKKNNNTMYALVLILNFTVTAFALTHYR